MSKKEYFTYLSLLSDKEREEVEEDFDPSLYAIFNPKIDHKLLQSIRDGNDNLKDDLKDERFFQLLAEDSAYLGTVMFQKQISKWQEVCLWPETYDKETLKAARSNLLKIGRVLARSGPGPGSPDRKPNYIIYDKSLLSKNGFRMK